MVEKNSIELLEEISAKIKSFKDPKLRAVYLIEKLKKMTSQEIAEILTQIYKAARTRRDEGYMLLLMTLFYEDLFVEKLGLTKISEIYMSLGEEKEVEELTDLIHSAYKRWQEKKKPSYIPSKDEHVEIRELTLGEKKFLARKPDRNTIEKIRTVKDPGVVSNLLNNPRVLERDILALVTKRPNNPDVIRLISQHPRWNMRYNVRKAIVFNPFTPIDVALKFINFLMTQDLKEVVNDKMLSPFLRKKSEELLKQRKISRGN